MNKKIAVFIIASFGFTWLFWLPLLVNRQWGMELPTLPGQFYWASFGPFFGSLLASLAGRGLRGVKEWTGRIFSIRCAARGLMVAVLLVLVYGVAAVSAHALLTGQWPEWSRFGLTQKLPGLNIWMTALVWMLTFGLGEESGWRGFLLPELHKQYPLMSSAFIVAAVWMLWHLPAFWFNQSYIEMGWGIFGWAISLAYGSLLLAWLCKASGWSIIPVIVWHGGFDLLTASDQSVQAMAMACSVLVIVHGVMLTRKLARTKAAPQYFDV